MTTPRRPALSSTTAIALIALFFALGGSAFAVGQGIQGVTAAQQRCANGAVRGAATVTGDSSGMANIGGEFTSRKAVFARAFNCTGRATQVRRVAAGVFEVRFVGNAALTAVANATSGYLAALQPVGAGTFRVSLYAAGRDDEADVAFTVIAV